jgi:hypothetical protein
MEIRAMFYLCTSPYLNLFFYKVFGDGIVITQYNDRRIVTKKENFRIQLLMHSKSTAPQNAPYCLCMPTTGICM